tara:strand:- start:49 stop:531 length:483 start_codon:yes stop_codon:yes gene_type:complete
MSSIMIRVFILTLLMVATPAWATPPRLFEVETVLGPKRYRDGDVIEITDAHSTSTRLEQGDTVVVKGRVRLDSRAEATLSLLLTQTKGNGFEETEVSQTTSVSQGLQNFELEITIKHQGVLHLTLYDTKTGKPFGGTYFGTAAQMENIADWNLSYYLDEQ